MLLRDFIFSYNQSLKNDLHKNKKIKFIKKIFYYPYKFFLDKLRELFLVKKNNLDKNIEFKNLKDLNLDELFIKFNTDKGSKFIMKNKEFSGHNYSPFYERFLSRFRNKKELKILEIGSLRGSATASFYYYFDNPQIFCADINPFQIQVFSKNIRKFFLDTQSKNSLMNLANYIKEEFDIIIDDGSHNIKDQITSISILFENLKNNGLYIIEDASQYLSSPNLNSDKLSYGAKEILLSVVNKDLTKQNYLDQNKSDFLNKKIKKISVENGSHYINGINISEILFIEKD
tara:strand:+ start:896 stop:1759 length:864 start_codon:yes stop_codon:yes gene_type:complete